MDFVAASYRVDKSTENYIFLFCLGKYVPFKGTSGFTTSKTAIILDKDIAVKKEVGKEKARHRGLKIQGD